MLRGRVVMFQLSSGCVHATCDLWRRRSSEGEGCIGEAGRFF